MKKNYWGSLGFAAWMVWAAVSVAGAQQTTPQGSQKLSIHIEAQPMAQALSELGDQTGLSIIVASAATDGVKAPAVDGSYTADEALQKIVTPAGLKVVYLSRTAVAIRVAQEGTDVKSEASKPAVSKPRAETELPSSVPSNEPTPPRDAKPAIRDQPQSNSEPRAAEEKKGIPEVLVKGSRVLNMDIPRSADDAQPYVIFTQEQIERSGATSVEDFLKDELSMATNATSQSQSLSPIGNNSSINLRGLGANQTLVLVDGHRLAGVTASGTPEQPDLNGIPLSAISRIEVLPTTASGIYGGSATGGVVNIVLRRDYKGIETRLTYGGTFDGGARTRRIDLNSGANWNDGRTNLILAGSYSDQGNLLIGQRDFAEQALQTIFINNPSFFTTPPVGATSNIRSSNGTNLTLKSGAALNSPITYVPVGYAGISGDKGAALAQNSGLFNLNLPPNAQGSQGSLLNAPVVQSLLASIRQEITERISAFVDLGFSTNTGHFLTNRASSTFALPSNSPYNPFNQAITITAPAFGADATALSKTTSDRAVAGLIAKLAQNWQMEVDYTWNRVRLFASTPNGLLPGASSAVSSGALNVLQDATPVSFSQFAYGPNIITPTYTTLKDIELRVAGSLFDTPGGPMTVSTLLEHRDEKLGAGSNIGPTSQTYIPAQSQSVDSVYLEANLPLFSDANSVPGIRLLALQVAGRRDRYDVNGANVLMHATDPVLRFEDHLSSTDPTAGIRWKPIKDLMFRASYGTGFLPPSVQNLAPGPRITIPAALAQLIGKDPLRGNTPLGSFTEGSGGSSGLRPEQSKSVSTGLVLSPKEVPGFRLSIDWTKIDKKDNLTNFPLSQQTIDSEAFVPGLIVRGPVAPGDPYGVGPITQVNAATLVNIARLRMEAFDFALDDHQATRYFGNFDVSIGATRLVHLQTQLSPIASVVENVGVTNAAINVNNTGGGLSWRGNGTITWGEGPWTVGWATHFFDSYWLSLTHTISVNQRESEVPSQIYHDVFASWTAPAYLSHGVLSGLKITAGVTDVFNKSPPQDLVGVVGINLTGYSYWGDPRLASYYVSLSKSF